MKITRSEKETLCTMIWKVSAIQVCRMGKQAIEVYEKFALSYYSESGEIKEEVVLACVPFITTGVIETKKETLILAKLIQGK